MKVNKKDVNDYFKYLRLYYVELLKKQNKDDDDDVNVYEKNTTNRKKIIRIIKLDEINKIKEIDEKQQDKRKRKKTIEVEKLIQKEIIKNKKKKQEEINIIRRQYEEEFEKAKLEQEKNIEEENRKKERNEKFNNIGLDDIDESLIKEEELEFVDEKIRNTIINKRNNKNVVGIDEKEIDNDEVIEEKNEEKDNTEEFVEEKNIDEIIEVEENIEINNDEIEEDITYIEEETEEIEFNKNNNIIGIDTNIEEIENEKDIKIEEKDTEIIEIEKEEELENIDEVIEEIEKVVENEIDLEEEIIEEEIVNELTPEELQEKEKETVEKTKEEIKEDEKLQKGKEEFIKTIHKKISDDYKSLHNLEMENHRLTQELENARDLEDVEKLLERIHNNQNEIDGIIDRIHGIENGEIISIAYSLSKTKPKELKDYIEDLENEPNNYRYKDELYKPFFKDKLDYTERVNRIKMDTDNKEIEIQSKKENYTNLDDKRLSNDEKLNKYNKKRLHFENLLLKYQIATNTLQDKVKNISAQEKKIKRYFLGNIEIKNNLQLKSIAMNIYNQPGNQKTLQQIYNELQSKLTIIEESKLVPNNNYKNVLVTEKNNLFNTNLEIKGTINEIRAMKKEFQEEFSDYYDTEEYYSYLNQIEKMERKFINQTDKIKLLNNTIDQTIIENDKKVAQIEQMNIGRENIKIIQDPNRPQQQINNPNMNPYQQPNNFNPYDYPYEPEYEQERSRGRSR